MDKITVIQDDIRNVDVDRFGEFDVVLCLGVLYHLEAHDAAALCQHMRAMCRFTVIRTAVALRTAGRVRIGDHVYRGLVYDEHPGTQPGASIDNPKESLAIHRWHRPSSASLDCSAPHFAQRWTVLIGCLR